MSGASRSEKMDATGEASVACGSGSHPVRVLGNGGPDGASGSAPPVCDSGSSASCPFCSPSGWLWSAPLWRVRADKFPVTPGHVLLVPRRHVMIWRQLNREELTEGLAIVSQFLATDMDFNLGINNGLAAGQTILHLHIHFIPRRFGDCDDPRGGVRGVIPEAQNYGA